MNAPAALFTVLALATAAVEASSGDESARERLRASGLWRTDYFQSSKALDDTEGLPGATLQLKALPTWGERIDGKIEWRVGKPDLFRSASTQTQLLEGWVTLRFAKADVYIGRQIVAWGRADGINPTDNLTPRDYTVLLPFEDDQRFGLNAVRVDWAATQEYLVSVFVTPFFEPSRVPLPTNTFRLLESRPPHDLQHTEAGVRLNRVGEGFDWSLSYFHGYQSLPALRLLDLDVERPRLELRYDRITVFGADFARNYGRFSFRGEVAYTDTGDDDGSDPVTRNPYLYWVVGVDRTFFTNLNLNLQYFQRRVRHHRGTDSFLDPLDRSNGRLNAAFNGQLQAVGGGMTFRISNKWLHETLEAELFAAANFGRSNSFLRPLVTYSFDDHWKGTLGAEIYSGPGDTTYGGLKKNRGAFLELRYGF